MVSCTHIYAYAYNLSLLYAASILNHYRTDITLARMSNRVA